jgi:effector-binding domain-containing protein
MLTEPKIVERKKQHYAAIRTTVSMNDIPHVLPPLIPEVADWLSKNNIVPDGAPFFRYLTMGNKLDVEVGIPVQHAINNDGRIVAGFFPAGKYPTITYMGDYIHIKEAHIALESWSKEKGYKATPGTITEVYITDPTKEPSRDKWQTDIIYRLDDGSSQT